MRSEFKEYYTTHAYKAKRIERKGQRFLLQIIRHYFCRLDLGSEEWHYVQHSVSKLPATSFSASIRSEFYEITMKRNCKGQFYCLPFVCFNFPQRIFIGNNVFINRNVNIVARDKIVIGDNVMIGPNTVINSGSHRFDEKDKLIRDQGHIKAPIIISNNVFIGGNVFILPGVTIGEGAVIGAGSIVTKDVDAFTVVAGNPAKVIRSR